MGEEEKPLVCAIMWGAKNRNTQKKFVLQVGQLLLLAPVIVRGFRCFYVLRMRFNKFSDTSLCIQSLCLIFWRLEV
jgi:hypothetical protein